MSRIVLDKETIFPDELIRENARLTVQLEADQQRVLALSDLVEQLEQGGIAAEAREWARTAEARLGGVNAMLVKAIEDLHFVMAAASTATWSFWAVGRTLAKSPCTLDEYARRRILLRCLKTIIPGGGTYAKSCGGIQIGAECR